MDRGVWWVTAPQGRKELDTSEQLTVYVDSVHGAFQVYCILLLFCLFVLFLRVWY